MTLYGNGYPDYTPFSEYEYEDECDGLTEEECNDIKNAVDVTFIMALLECSYEEMSEVVGQLAELFDGRRSEVDYTCFNGNRIRITMNGDGSLNIETEPIPLEELLPES